MADEVKSSGGGDRGALAAIAVETVAAADHVQADPVDVKADANFSGARRSASSAWRKLTPSITRTTARSGSLWPRAARLCRAG